MGELLYPLGLSETEKASLPVPDYTSAYYRMDYSVAAIRSYLNAVKECVRRNAFVVLKGDPDDPTDTRKKNASFMRRYGLWDKAAQQALLLSITEDEFCHAVMCNDGRELYVFCLDRMLYKTLSGFEQVRIYVKHDYAQGISPFNVVVSLHELELPILKAFED